MDFQQILLIFKTIISFHFQNIHLLLSHLIYLNSTIPNFANFHKLI